MIKYILLLGLFLVPSVSFAAFPATHFATSTTQGSISPSRIGGAEQALLASFMMASSTSRASTFPYASTTMLTSGSITVSSVSTAATSTFSRASGDAGGKVVFGVNPGLIPTSAFNIASFNFDGAQNTLSIGAHGSNSVQATAGLITYSSRGTSAAPTATQSGDTIFILGGRGWGTSYSNDRARIQFVASQTWDGSSNGTYTTFSTTPNNSTTQAEVMRIDQNGSVGIGTTSPYAKLSIHANNLETATTLFSIASSTQSATTTLFVIMNTGNVGVATTSPFGTFTVEQGTEPSSFWVGNQGSTTPSLTVSGVNGNGNVGVGSSTPWRTLDINGTIGIKGITTSSGFQTAVLCQSANNEMIADSVACLASSGRNKEGINRLNNGLDELMKLKPVSFFYKPEFNGKFQSDPNYNGEQVGFIAEDVQKIDSRLITLETSGKYEGLPHSVRYENMSALIVDAVQKFYKQFQSLVAKVSGLEKRVNEQDKRIKLLEKRLNKLKI